MPIEYCYRPMDSATEYDNALIERGDGIFISTYPDGQRRVIAIDCNPSDDGGSVKILAAEGVFEDPTTDLVEHDDLPSAEETIWIDEQRPHEQLIVTPDEETGFIVARYASPEKITRSLLIPLGLIFPDIRVIINQ